jgi:hypothetical protein
MNLKIVGLFDHGKPNERLTLDVLEDTNLKNYLLLDDTFSNDGKLSNKERHPFWFPDWEVEKGDVVNLYTHKGENHINLMKLNGKHIIRFGKQPNVHLIYWNLKSGVWNKDGDEAFLIQLKTFDKIVVKVADK